MSTESTDDRDHPRGDRVRVLFLDMDNAGRSQMAEGLLRHLGGERYEGYSAGPFPTHLAPEAVEVMKEIGVDISGQRSRSSRAYLGQQFDHVLQICDQSAEACPVFPGSGTRTCWPVPDPAAASRIEGDTLAAYRDARDRILGLVSERFGRGPAARHSPARPVEAYSNGRND